MKQQTQRRGQIPGIDEWIAENGLDAQIDGLIRTCGYDKVSASIDGAPARFGKRMERVVGYRPLSVPGAPLKRDAWFYERLFNAVEGLKRRYSLKDKDACYRLARGLATLKMKLAREDALNLLQNLGFDDIAGLKGSTIYREWKRAKSFYGTKSKQAKK